MVLVSPAAADSEWVGREVDWAVTEFEAGGLVERIIPVVLPGGGWDDFPKLFRFQRVDYPHRSEAIFFDDLARELSDLPRRQRAH